MSIIDSMVISSPAVDRRCDLGIHVEDGVADVVDDSAA